VDLVRIDVSEERIAFIIGVKGISELRTSLAVTSVFQLLVIANAVSSSLIPFTLMMEVIRSSDTSVFTRASRCDIREDGILRCNRREILKSYSS
jgi:hypothetical protein